MQLLPFQSAASSRLTDRFEAYMRHPDPPMFSMRKKVPFYQNLSAITGAGKTVILADGIERMREVLPSEPIVLWVSKGKVVVEQTFSNLENGKYQHLIPGYRVKPLAECTKEDLEEEKSLLLMATVATFNQRDKDRRVFRLALDRAEQSLWDRLKVREGADGVRRPLIIVYDEGHNLSDQQTDLLLDLAPDAIISASATPRLTAQLGRIIERLKEAGWQEEELCLHVNSGEIVDSGLIKAQIVLGGYDTSMETAIDEMLKDREDAAGAAGALGLDFKPKAIYVCATNVVEGGIDRHQKDDPHQPFLMRKAPPILIWRYLTEQKGVEASKIAVYCDLHTHKDYPLPEEFVLFRGGDKDYAAFSDGGYEHVIFNLSLQEGWDDPECYFAYIDKSMGSQIQIEQLIGRVLRQPGGRHYPNARLNTAHFYVRVDNRTVFPEILSQVQAGLAEDAAALQISHYLGREQKKRVLLEVKKERSVPKVSVDATHALREIACLPGIHDYRHDQSNVRGIGAKAQVFKRVGRKGDDDAWEWVESCGGNRITARALFVRKIQSLYPRAINVCNIEDPKFDALVEAGSLAAKAIESQAATVVDTFVTHSRLLQKPSDLQTIGPVYVDPDRVTKYRHALHDGYSDLNGLERAFAEAIDRKRLAWCRNPSKSGVGVPLLRPGASLTFYPDFLVWSGSSVLGIDTKGEHLLTESASRKLLSIDQKGPGQRLVLRLVSRGQWSNEVTCLSDEIGYTVWTMRDGRPAPIRCKDIDEAVERCLQV